MTNRILDDGVQAGAEVGGVQEDHGLAAQVHEVAWVLAVATHRLLHGALRLLDLGPDHSARATWGVLQQLIPPLEVGHTHLVP